MGASKEKSVMDDNPLNILEDIENIQEILDDQEMRLVNNIFVDMKEFYRITECIELALLERKIDRRDLRVLYNSILKVVMHNYHVRMAEEKQKKRNYLRVFFDLPEILNKWLFHARVLVHTYNR
jgi:hypothetical protein